MAILHVVGIDHLLVLGERPAEPGLVERIEVRLETPLNRAAAYEADAVPGEVADVVRGRGGRHHHRMGFHEDGGTGYHQACQLLLVNLRAREEVNVVLLVAHGVEVLRRLVLMVFDAIGGSEHRGSDRTADVDVKAGPATVTGGTYEARPLDAAAADDTARLHAFDDGARSSDGDRAADTEQGQQDQQEAHEFS